MKWPRETEPSPTTSIKIAMNDLKLDEFRVIYPGSLSYPLAKNISVLPLASLAE